MVLLDTNAILRYALQDNQEMANSVERNAITQAITQIVDANNVRLAQGDVVLRALDVFASSTLDFVDCLLVGYAKEKRYRVFTFDKKLQKFLQ